MKVILANILLLTVGCTTLHRQNHRTWTMPGVSCPQTFVHGGTLTRRYPAVGILRLPGARCTATLVSKTVILTAAHCSTMATMDIPAGLVSFVLDDGRSFHVIRMLVADTASFGLNDYAFGVLSEKVTGVDPLPIGDPGVIMPDHELGIVGFGCQSSCTDADGETRYLRTGKKRWSRFSATGFVHEGYRSDLFWSCPGDSGGPIIDITTNRVIGVVSGSMYVRHNGRKYFTSMHFADPRPWATTPLSQELTDIVRRDG